MTPDAGPERFVLIIGSMKAGTTSLFSYLAAHPAVAPSQPKEPDFFTGPSRWGDDPLATYRALWDWDPERHDWALEASTSYTKMPAHLGVPGRVKSLGDYEFRFIYVMRDPVQRMASHLTHLATRKGRRDRAGVADFEAALAVSRYAMQLDAWVAHWPRETILPLVFEEMAQDPAAVVACVHAFLDLPPADLDLGEARIHNARTEMAADQVLSGLLDRAPWLEPIHHWLPTPLRTATRSLAGRWGSHEVALAPGQRQRAIEVLKPEARRIREEWGVDTSRWKSVA